MVAHVLTGSPFPLAGQWAAAVALFGGAVLSLIARRRTVRRAAAALAALGLGATAAALLVAAVQPGPPPYTLRIASPADNATVPEDLVLTVCGVRGDGSTVAATDAQHYLVVFVDGHEVPTVDVWHVPEHLPQGRHTIRVELVTPQHHAFAPPATATVQVDVAAVALPPAIVGC